jgi:hypothetical protein
VSIFPLPFIGILLQSTARGATVYWLQYLRFLLFPSPRGNNWKCSSVALRGWWAHRRMKVVIPRLRQCQQPRYVHSPHRALRVWGSLPREDWMNDFSFFTCRTSPKSGVCCTHCYCIMRILSVIRSQSSYLGVDIVPRCEIRTSTLHGLPTFRHAG